MTTAQALPGDTDPLDWVIGGRAPTWPSPRSPEEDEDYEPNIVRGRD